MIEDLNSIELQAYYNRVLESGIDGLKGIEVFQAKQLKKFAESLQSRNLDLVHKLLIANPAYDYPEKFKGGKEIDYWMSSIVGFNEPLRVLNSIDQFLGIGKLENQKDTRFWLTSLWNEVAQKTSDFIVLKNQIETHGHFIANGAKVYTTELAYILCTPALDVKNLDTQVECSINGSEYIGSYVEGFLEGEKYFDSAFSVSTDTLYGGKGEQYVRDLHENYYHAEHETFMEGWQDVKRTYPSIVTHKVVRKAGYYSGIVNKVDALVAKYPKAFQHFDKCEHDLPMDSRRNRSSVPKIESLQDLFETPGLAEKCVNILRTVDPPLIDDSNRFIGNSKGALCIWIDELRKAGILRHHSDRRVYATVLNEYFKGFSINESMFAKLHPRASDKYQGQFRLAISQLSQK